MADNKKQPLKYKSKFIDNSRIDLLTEKYENVYLIDKEITNQEDGSVNVKTVVVHEVIQNKFIEKYGYQNLTIKNQMSLETFKKVLLAFDNL